MPSYDSPLGSKQLPNQPLREFDVPDDSELAQNSVNPVFQAQRNRRLNQDLQNFGSSGPSEEDLLKAEREMQAARQERRLGKSRLSEGAKRRVEMLIGMTRLTRNCDIEGNTFVLQSLKSKEVREAIAIVSTFDGTVQSPFEMRRQMLARSLIQISGIDINDFLGSSELEDKLNFIDELDDNLSSRLYNEYLNLNNEVKEKYSIKTDIQAKETVEDLKK